jgi:hypothetical protein
VLSSDRQRASLALVLFFLAQCVGLFLRALPIWPQTVNYTYVLYGHTHVALTGWVQAALYLALQRILPQELAKNKRYSWIWTLNLIATLGMLIAFPLQGYKAISIIFSSSAIILSYVFAWQLWQDSQAMRHEPAWRSIRIGLLFLLLCSVGPWSLGFLMVRFPGSDWIKLAVYFYLHFLYNGFFSFVVLGLCLDWLAKALPETKNKVFWPVGLMAIACLPAYSLSALWTHPQAWVWILAGLSGVLQLIALLGLFPILRPLRAELRSANWVYIFLAISLMSFVAKILLQAISALPQVALPLGTNRYLIIAYLHLVFLGFISCFILAFFLNQGLLQPTRAGFALIVAGVFCSEVLLFTAGLWGWLGWGSLPSMSWAVFISSALIPLGTAWLLKTQLIMPTGLDEVRSGASFSISKKTKS